MQSLKSLREKYGYSQTDIAHNLGITRQAYNHYETGKREPDNNTLLKLALILNVSTDHLLGKNKKKGVLIPVLGYVRAGIPMDAVEEILDYEEISEEMASQGEYFALSIKGDSMEPRICEGDVVIVKKQSDIDSGSLAVILINGTDATVKKIIKKGTSLTLVPYNVNKYETIIYDQIEIDTLPVEIIGKVVELRGKFH